MTKKISAKKIRKAINSSTSLKTSTPALGEIIDSNVDLLSEILSFVPPNSLITFKSISKNWLHLISGSHFSFNYSC
ncbi:hypothetical protein CsSME_00008413 [Camellia sinensis var. sinensis]